MTRTRWVLISILVVLGILAGAMYVPWGSKETGPIRKKDPDRPTRTVTDTTGREVTIPQDPRRILSLCASATDTVVRLGEGSRLTAIGLDSTAIPGSGAARVVGRGDRLNRRQVAAVNPDMAFTWEDDSKTNETLERLNVPVVRFIRPMPNEVPDLIRFVGKCVNRPDRAKTLASSIKEYLDGAQQKKMPEGKTSRPTVYLELGGPFRTAGSGTYPHALLRMAGARNAAAGIEGYGEIPSQTLLDTDPDVILYLSRGGRPPAFKQRPGLGGLTAVRKKRMAPVQKYWLIPGAGMPAAVQGIRKAIKNPAPEDNEYRDILNPEDL